MPSKTNHALLPPVRLSSFFSFCFIFLSGCTSFIYQPDSYMYSQPEKMTPIPQQIALQGPEGRIIVWKFSKKGSKKTKIILFHGNAQNISSHFYSLYWLPGFGYDYYIFDYPSYGGSQGNPSQENVAKTSQIVVDWVINENPSSKIAFVGQSLGGNVAAYTAAQTKKIYKHKQNICLLVLDSTFKSYRTVARRVLAKSWLTWPFQWLGWILVAEEYSAKEAFPLISPVPSIVFHGDQDEIVAYKNGLEVFEALQPPKEFITVVGGQHIDAFLSKDRLVYQKIFLDRLKTSCDNLSPSPVDDLNQGSK